MKRGTKANEVAPYSVGRYAVFRHTRLIKNVKFSSFHDNLGSAEAEAVRLLTVSVTERGEDANESFYVVEVKAAFRYLDKQFSQDLKFEPA
jgi:hypothetical protein